MWKQQQKGSTSAPAPAAPKPAPAMPAAAANLSREQKVELAKQAIKRGLKTKLAELSKQPAKPAITIEHPDVIPASQAPQQAAVDAAVSHAIRQDEAKQQPAAAPAARSPKQAALELRDFLRRTGRFGTLKDRPDEVKAAQSDMGVTADGIVGRQTRAAARKLGVVLPPVKK